MALYRLLFSDAPNDEVKGTEYRSRILRSVPGLQVPSILAALAKEQADKDIAMEAGRIAALFGSAK
jgi:hypothetical protein